MTTRNLRFGSWILAFVVTILLLTAAALADPAAPPSPAGGTVPPPRPIYAPLIHNATPPEPTLVMGISAGDEFTCALSTLEEVYCWGAHTVDPWINAQRQFDVVPLKVEGLERVQQISAGTDHVCALLLDKTVQCWGWNIYGQLGDGSKTESATPVAVPGLTGVAQLEAGTRGTCVLLEDSSVECWGTMILNEENEFVEHFFATPTQIEGLESGVAQISMGGMHGCALMDAGGVKCWGPNFRGALGNGTLDDSLAAVDVVGLPEDIVSVAAGIHRACAITSEGALKCWGSNEFDNLGDGSDVDYSTTPVDVVGMESGVRTVDIGLYSACATMDDGTVRCWGTGTLGDGSGESSSTPVEVVDLENAWEVTVGRFHTCAVTTMQGATCWGENYYGQLGNGSVLNRLTPTWVAGMDNR